MDLLKNFKFQISNFKLFFAFCMIVLFPLGEVIRITLSNGIAFIPFDIGIIFLLCLWISLSWMTNPFKSFLTKPILFFILACVLSLLVNITVLQTNEVLVAILYLFRWIFYAGLFFITVSSKNLKKNLPIIFMVSGGVMVLFGYLQYFYYPVLRNLFYLGWDEHYQRMFGTFFDPNFLGAFLVLYLLFLIGLLLKQKLSSWPNIVQRTSYLLLPLTLIAIFLTFSRSAYLMVFVSVLTLFFILGKKKWIRGFVIVFVLFAVTYVTFFRHPSEGTNLFRTTSAFARVGATQTAWKIFISHPVFGVGFNAYRFAQRKYGFLPGNDWMQSHAGAGTDNSFLFVLGTTGIIGFTAYLSIWLVLLKKSWKERKKNMYAAVFFASAIGLFVDSFFINSLFYAFIMVWMWGISGLLAEDA